MPSPVASTSHVSAPSIERHPVEFVHTISEAGRLLPSASRWNSIELDFRIFSQSSTAYNSLPSRFSKSFDYDLVITDKKHFKRFAYISASVVLVILALILLVLFLPHKHKHNANSKNLTLAVNQALTFFDAQKCNLFSISPLKLYFFNVAQRSTFLFLVFCSWAVSEEQPCKVSRRFGIAGWKCW